VGVGNQVYELMSYPRDDLGPGRVYRRWLCRLFGLVWNNLYQRDPMAFRKRLDACGIPMEGKVGR
jgi:hypothetical protein